MPEYDADFYGWANEQAALLRAGRLGEVDIANVAEEIESMGRIEKRELVSRLAVLLQHLLKWQVQPTQRDKSWRLTIEEQRDLLETHLEENPSLKPKLPKALGEAFRHAVRVAQKDTDLERDAFPAVSPWSIEAVLDDGFFPE